MDVTDSKLNIVIYSQRRMVAEPGLLINIRPPCTACQLRRSQVVIQPPPDVINVGLPSVAPPGVGGVGGVGVQVAVDIDQATAVFRGVQQLGHPGALFGQKAAVLLVAAPVLQIDLLVRDIEVAAQNEFALAFCTHQVRMEVLQKAEFGQLAFFA